MLIYGMQPPLDINYNFDSKKISKKNLENKDSKWGLGQVLGSI